MDLPGDAQVDTRSMHLDDGHMEVSKEVQPGILLDWNAQTQVVALEILSVWEHVS
jgi:hypothetical protein